MNHYFYDRTNLASSTQPIKTEFRGSVNPFKSNYLSTELKETPQHTSGNLASIATSSENLANTMQKKLESIRKLKTYREDSD